MRTSFFSFLCLLISVFAMAQPQAGKVYNLKNVGKGNSLGISNMQKVIAVTTDANDVSQQWYVESVSGTTFSLRNMMSGLYLKGHESASNNWTLVANKVDLECTSTSGAFAIRQSEHSGTHAYLHIDGSGNAVSWEPSNQNTQWKFEEVSYTKEQIDNVLNSTNDLVVTDAKLTTYQNALNALFKDKACTQLNGTFTEAQMKSNANYLALPAALQQMVLKVLAGSWTEANGNPSKQQWDSDYAKKYRVQLCEPYNEPEAAAKALKINAHTNLNNPTGIYSKAGSQMYVMVEGEIKDGASLYLVSYTGHGKLGGYADGIVLKSGLNIVPSYFANYNYCINYVVHTFDTSDGKTGKSACKRKLSDYPALKIHIEGGYINGYYNKEGDALYAADKNTDWEYLEARATQTDLTVLGKYITLQFPLNDGDTEGNKGLSYYFNERVKIEDAINEWDNVMLWERLLMGVVDEATVNANAKKSPYSSKSRVIDYIGNDGGAYACDYGDYYNVHGLSFGVGGDSYMYGGWDHCGYHYNTMGGVIETLPTNAGSHWGPGHEIGHQHQGPLNMNGLTEVTNNLFSNVVLWYYGESTSRYNGSEGALFNVLKAYNTKGSDFFTNNIWAQTHMYYKLFLYYHVLGNNPKFYPVLFEMLRQDPMQIKYEQSGVASLLHFYKKCCLASGNDLTEFFRAHGFFRVMKDRLVGDYSNSNYNMTQEDIDAAIAEVKALKYPENLAVLYVNDGTGETIKSHKGDNLDFYNESTICADLGSYASFATVSSPSYTYSYSNQTITMTGTGGIGFAVVSDDNELVSFSDKKTFEVSEHCAQLLLHGKAKVMGVKADGTFVEAGNSLDMAGENTLYAQLGEVLSQSAALLSLVDETGQTRPGFFLSAALEPLKTVYNNAKSVYDNEDAGSYAAVLEALNSAYINVIADKTNRVPFVPGSTYALTNSKYPDKSMSLDGNGKLVASATDMAQKTQQWIFESAPDNDTYYIKNNNNQKYIGALTKSQQPELVALDLAKAYKLYDLENGLWALQCQTDKDQMSLHTAQSSNVVGWWHNESGHDASWWYLTATSHNADKLMEAELTALIEKSKELLAQVGSVSESCALSTEQGSIYRLTDNNGASEGNLANLLDGNTTTYYVSNWGNDVSTSPYLQVEAAEGYELSNFSITYTTRKDGGAPVPATIEISASTNGVNYVTLQTFKKDANALPAASNAESWTSPEYGNDETAYRYVRFTVTEGYRSSSSNNSKGICHFGISEFAINNLDIEVESKYTSFSEDLLLSFHRAIIETEQTLASAQSQQYADAYSKLESQYNSFLAAKNGIDNKLFESKKAELKTLIDKTTELIALCGTVKNISLENIVLQTTAPNDKFYLSTNAPEPKEGAIANLLDGNSSTFFHSAWSTDIDEVHHLMVNVADEAITNSIKFSYQCSKGPFPYEIKVYGATDNNGPFELFKTFTKDDAMNALPTVANKVWTSEEILPTASYKYLRFDVTKSGAPDIIANPKGEYCFEMSEFDLTLLGESYDVTLNGVGQVTKELLLSVYKQNEKVKAAYSSVILQEYLEKLLVDLTAKYDALYNAAYYYTVIIGESGYTTLYTTKALTLPEGLTAYAIKTVKDNVAILEPMQGIAANQGAILYGTPDTYILTPGQVTANWTGNRLKGTATDTYVQGNAYVLAMPKDENVGLYKALLNKNASGADGNTHFLNNAGKAYLPATDVTNGARFLSFDLDTETSISDVETEEGSAVVYDITGRRVQKAQNGIFIVNGKIVIK